MEEEEKVPVGEVQVTSYFYRFWITISKVSRSRTLISSSHPTILLGFSTLQQPTARTNRQKCRHRSRCQPSTLGKRALSTCPPSNASLNGDLPAIAQRQVTRVIKR